MQTNTTNQTKTVEYDRRGDEARVARDMRPTEHETSALAETLLRSGAPEAIRQQHLEGEINDDHVLGNLKDEELHERRFNIRNNLEFNKAMHPPAESVLQGDLRDEFGLKGPKHPLTTKEVHDLHDSADAVYARSTRAREGWFTESLIKSIQELRRPDDRKESDSSSNSILGGLLGGGK